MSGESTSKVYCIRIKERVDANWTGWLGNLQFEYTPAGETMIVGPIIDQTALHGLLERIRDLNLTLISITSIDDCEED